MTTTDYNQQAIDFLNKTGATLEITYKGYGKHFSSDTEERDIYKCVLQRGTRKYEFDFGNSIVKSGKFQIKAYKRDFKFNTRPNYDAIPNGYRPNEVKVNPDFAEPTAYDILSCLQKYEVGSFDDFVSEFGYEFKTQAEYKQTLKTYNAVVEEVTAVKMLFTDAEIEALQEIQ